MELQYSVQDYQTEAVEAVAEVFRSQPPGRDLCRNSPLALPEAALLENIRRVQGRNNTPLPCPGGRAGQVQSGRGDGDWHREDLRIHQDHL